MSSVIFANIDGRIIRIPSSAVSKIVANVSGSSSTPSGDFIVKSGDTMPIGAIHQWGSSVSGIYSRISNDLIDIHNLSNDNKIIIDSENITLNDNGNNYENRISKSGITITNSVDNSNSLLKSNLLRINTSSGIVDINGTNQKIQLNNFSEVIEIDPINGIYLSDEEGYSILKPGGLYVLYDDIFFSMTGGNILLKSLSTNEATNIIPYLVSSLSIIGRERIQVNYNFGNGSTFTVIDSQDNNSMRLGAGLPSNGVVRSSKALEVVQGTNNNWESGTNKIRLGDTGIYDNNINISTTNVRGFVSISRDFGSSGGQCTAIAALMKGTGAGRKSASSFVSVTTDGLSIGVYGSAVGNTSANPKIGLIGINTDTEGSFNSAIPTGTTIGTLRNWNVGVAGMALGTAKTQNVGVYGFASDSTDNFAGVFDGSVFINNANNTENLLSIGGTGLTESEKDTTFDKDGFLRLNRQFKSGVTFRIDGSSVSSLMSVDAGISGNGGTVRLRTQGDSDVLQLQAEGTSSSEMSFLSSSSARVSSVYGYTDSGSNYIGLRSYLQNVNFVEYSDNGTELVAEYNSRININTNLDNVPLRINTSPSQSANTFEIRSGTTNTFFISNDGRVFATQGINLYDTPSGTPTSIRFPSSTGEWVAISRNGTNVQIGTTDKGVIIPYNLTVNSSVTFSALSGDNLYLRIDSSGNVSSFEEWVSPPSGSTAPGIKGQKAVDSLYLYFCSDTDTWHRVAKYLTSW